MRYVCILTLCLAFISSSYATTYYVSLSGNNGNDGSAARPWRTIQHAVSKVPAGQGHTIKISAGTFVENQIHVPAGVNILGEGRDATIIKANSSFYFYPSSPGFSNEKYLIRLYSGGASAGNQSVKNLTVDGDGKKVHGGIFIHNRSNVVVDNVRIQYFNFNGLWFSHSNNSSAKNIILKDCAWGSASWCSAALQFAHSSNLDISNFDIDEGRGYGIKNLGHDQNQPLTNVKLHHGKVSVHQSGLWNNGSAPNITIEFWASGYSGTEIYNTYVDNHISIINPNNTNSGTPLKIYNNVFDILGPRTKGSGYGMELSASNVEVRNNYFYGGYTGIVNWVAKVYSNWNVHHNVFYGISGGVNPSAVVTSYKGGLSNANFYNNTVEMSSTNQAVHFVEFDNGSRGTNVNIKNNLVINGPQAANRVVNLRNGSSVSGLNVTNNYFQNIAQGTAPGNFSGNVTGTAGIARSGARPQGYYNHVAGGNLIDKGAFVGMESKPDIGACGDNNKIGTAAPVSAPAPAPSPSPVAVTSVAISPAALSVAVSATGTLARTIAPANASNQSVTWTSNNTGVARVDANGVVTGVATGTAVITVRSADGNKSATASITVTAKPSTAGVDGRLTRQAWTGISGSNLSSLKSNANFPNKPNNTSTITSFAGPINWAESYGSRIFGYIRPQTSGNYTFWISSDDESELYLSTDQNPANKAVIARAPGYTSPGQLTKYPQQKSATINLVAGRYYYVEALHKDGGSLDHVNVYWQGPGIAQSIISSAYISTTAGTSSNTTVPVASVAIAPASVNVGVNGSTALSKVISPSNASNHAVNWTSSNTAVARVDAQGVVTGVAAGSATISARTADGNKTGSCTVKVTTAATPAPAPAPPASSGPRDGRLTRMTWTGISGDGLAGLKSHSKFPGTPNHRVTITQFEAPSNWGDNFGSRIFGYIIPPVSGAYTFWIAGDNNCELYLSTDRNASKKSLIASVPGATAKGELGKYTQQKSVVKNLVAGTYYYIEALHKESTGTDHVAVYWQGPGISQSIIPGSYLSTMAGSGGGGGTPQFAEEEVTSNFVVYPVPVERGSDFIVEVPAASTEVRVIDMNGRQFRSVAVNNETKLLISSEGLESGLYYMQVLNPHGSAFKKVMVK